MKVEDDQGITQVRGYDTMIPRYLARMWFHICSKVWRIRLRL